MTSTGDKGIGIKGWLSGHKPQTKTTEAKTEPTVLDEHRVAVLPFANMSPDPNDEYFTDGMTEELITKLSEISELKVIARTSVMSYKRKEKKISEIGSELGVGSVIEGSVRKAGNKVRVTVQLIDVRTEEHLWASNYDRVLDDIFAIQSDIASRVAGSFMSRVPKSGQRKDTDDIEAYTLYLRAMQLYYERTEQSLREAIELFNRAISRDERFARAYAGLAHTWDRMASTGYEDFTLAVGKADTAARNALAVGSDWAESHAAMSDVHDRLDRFAEAILEAEMAVRINPNLSEAHFSLGSLQTSLGNLEQGLNELKRAYELDPLSYHAGRFVAYWSMLAGREGEAFDILERMKKLNPKNPEFHMGLAECYMLKRNFSAAQKALDAGLEISPAEPWLLILQGRLYALTNRRKEAKEQLQLLLGDDLESVRLMGQLYIQAGLGNLDEAFKALMRGVETHTWPGDLKTDPFFEGIRRDRRFAEFCMKVGLPA